MATQSSPTDDNPSPLQLFSYFSLLFLLIIIVLSNSSQSTLNTALIDSDDEQNLFSNPQIDESEVPIIDAEAPAMPVAMFNLENPNGWETPETVTLVGTFQSELGCELDNTLDCDATEMTYDIVGDIWQTSLDLPTGEYEYRLHLDKSESHIYGKNGIGGVNSFMIPLVVDAPQTVKFYYDHKTGWITDNINSLILTLPSNFQNKVGCREEWNAACFRTWLQDIDGDGIYTYETLLVPGGSWEARVAVDGDIDTSYGQGGTFDGDNIPLWIANIGHLSVFTWDSNLKTLTIFVSNVPIRLSTDLPFVAPNE